MKICLKMLPIFLTLLLCFSCSDDGKMIAPNPNNNPFPDSIPVVIPDIPVVVPNTSKKYLALGDSYTIGQNVCETCRFPAQLKDSLQLRYNINTSVKIIATTGWTTTNLISAINNQNPTTDYDLVTLLIGVNNQYQNKPFSLYEQEFPQLVNKAIAFAKNDINRVVVVSIPDYAFTPYGNGNMTISQQISQYNAFAQNYCISRNIKFVNITDITRQGLNDLELVASDGLHPSSKAYSKFVNLILPQALSILQQP